MIDFEKFKQHFSREQRTGVAHPALQGKVVTMAFKKPGSKNRVQVFL